MFQEKCVNNFNFKVTLPLGIRIRFGIQLFIQVLSLNFLEKGMHE